MDRPIRHVRARVAAVVVLSVAAGMPAAVEAQDVDPRHPAGLSLHVQVAPESAFQRAARFRSTPHRMRCSRVKGAFIGAAVGFGTGAVYGAIAGPSKYGILGTRQRADALVFGTIGAGAGALVGIAFCS